MDGLPASECAEDLSLARDVSGPRELQTFPEKRNQTDGTATIHPLCFSLKSKAVVPLITDSVHEIYLSSENERKT